MSSKYQISHWEYDTFLNEIDFCIIGSGIVGLSSAVHLKLKYPKAKVLVLERGLLPQGASTRNAGFACFGSMTELLDDLESRPADEVWALVERRYRGLLYLRELLGDQAIGYLPQGGYELFSAVDQMALEECLDHLHAFNTELKAVTAKKETFVVQKDAGQGFGFTGFTAMILNQAEGSIHTGNMMQALLKKAYALGVMILNNVEVDGFQSTSNEVKIQIKQNWNLSCQQLIVATNGFSNILLPELEVEPARNQVLITSPIPDLKAIGCFHYDRGYYYFRNVGKRLLLGGGRHLAKEAETTAEFGPNKLIRQALVDLLEHKILPGKDYQIERWWTGVLGVGEQKTPIVKHIDDRVSVAIRLGGMGVAIGSLVGKEVVDLL